MGEIGQQVQKIYVPGGCPKCLGTGFFGRRAFFEMLKVNDDMRDVILKNPSMNDIAKAISASNPNFKRLGQSGYQLVADGAVAFQEVDRAVGRI